MPDINPIAEGAKSLSDSLMSAREAGKELTKTIETIQHDAVDVASQKNHERRKKARSQEDKESLLVHKAIEEYERLNKIIKLEKKAESEFLVRYGKKEWDKVLELKALIEKEEKTFKKEYDKDLQAIKRLQLWCFLAAACVTYMLWAYKLV
jgi:hypothetical protein